MDQMASQQAISNVFQGTNCGPDATAKEKLAAGRAEGHALRLRNAALQKEVVADKQAKIAAEAASKDAAKAAKDDAKAAKAEAKDVKAEAKADKAAAKAETRVAKPESKRKATPPGKSAASRASSPRGLQVSPGQLETLLTGGSSASSEKPPISDDAEVDAAADMAASLIPKIVCTPSSSREMGRHLSK